MRSARAVIAGALVLAFMLSACVGIPTSGRVLPGSVIGDRSDPEVVVLPSGPLPGSSQEEILADFMLALRGPQSDYVIARQFLTSAVAGSWNPDAGAIIRTGAAQVTQGVDANALEYSVTTEAFVDSDGRYFEQAPAVQRLNYGFSQENGEWRISSAPDGIVLSQSGFDVVFTEHALYFFDPSYQYLVPDVRWFAARTTVTTRIVRELLDGPSDWLGQGVLLNAFPVATSVASSEIINGTAAVELSAEAFAASPLDRDRMRQQLAASLDVATVAMTVGELDVSVQESGVSAIRNPVVEAAVLVGSPTAIGFDAGEGVVPLQELSAQALQLGVTAATLSSDRQTLAMLTPGGVAVARTGVEQPFFLDRRPDLVAPALDPFGFVWSAQSSTAGSLTVTALDGTVHPLRLSFPVDARVVSVDVSRDGSRLLASLITPVGPRLVVAGIIRQQGSNAPIELGEPVDLSIPPGTPIDATWINDRSVAVISRSGESWPITVIEIGGPSASIGQVKDAIAIAGGIARPDGLRVLAADGTVWQPRGGGGWVATGITASFLGTKQ